MWYLPALLLLLLTIAVGLFFAMKSLKSESSKQMNIAITLMVLAILFGSIATSTAFCHNDIQQKYCVTK